MKIITKNILAIKIVISFVFIVSCGGPSFTGDMEGGALQVLVKGSRSFNSQIDHGRIIAYRVAVSGDGIEEPIVAEFRGDATEGMISGIPAGNDRQVVVEAINPNELVIRQGEAQNISIQGGAVAHAEVELQPVPIFANIADGNTIDNTRLVFRIFSDPASVVVVEEMTSGPSALLTNAATSTAEVNLDILTGLGTIAPALQPVGPHAYQVKDVNTGRSSTVNVKLVDGTRRRFAPLYSAGDCFEPRPKSRLYSGTALLPFLQ